MQCHVTLRREASGVVARCSEFPECEGRGPSAADAVSRLRAAVLFVLETCPCDQTAEPGLVMTIVEDRSSA